MEHLKKEGFQRILKEYLKPDIQIKPNSKEKGQVIIHCNGGDILRLWPNHTFLKPHGSNSICKLVYSEGISLYPRWIKGPIKFTLIFEGLPKGCESFDLFEQIPEPGGFRYLGIFRNKTDVYKITF
ncbi:MAG: hypothetical protein H8E84_05200 [Flavobacteriales bacterium]|nr:hypothetical protein [Flavobacteriales bacterium]